MSFRSAVRPVGGVPIRVSSLPEAVDWLCAQATSSNPGPVDVHLANAYTIALAHQDDEYRQLLCQAEAVFPDGRPMVWLTRFSRAPLSQVRGPSLFEATMDRGREVGVRHFLLGASDETLELLKAELCGRYPGLNIVGTHSPPFRPLLDAEQLSQDALIRESGANLVWVGLGTPKQDREAQRLARELLIPAVAVGAAFDFSAGTKPIAPAWMRNSGLEWLHRMASEPRRLWKRYLIGNAVFLIAVTSRRREAGKVPDADV